MERNNKLPLISIIVPVYNVRKYLSNCVESITHQSYPHTEIILVDDGSNDGSDQLCDEYCDKYANCKVIHKHNEGLGFARNTGLKYVKGEFVTFCDSDDWLDSTFIESLYNNLITNDADFCKSGFRYVHADRSVIEQSDYPDETFDKSKIFKILIPRILGSSPEQHDGIEPAVCATLYKTSIIRDNGLTFKSERQYISEDIIFNIEYLKLASKAYISSVVGYNYRNNPTSLTRRYLPDRFEKCLFFYDVVKRLIASMSYGRSVVYRLDRLFFIQLRMCIKQEGKRISQKPFRDRYKKIEEICQNKATNAAIDGYPVKRLGKKQQIFLILIKKRFVLLLVMLADLNIM
jgi:glycosyltransferase involved in cell wall biosynthesis